MTSDLDALCEARGIELSYISETGEHRRVDDRVKQALLDALEHDGAATVGSEASSPPRRCYMPDWLEHGRAWGVTAQLFGVRSERNHGIGDFEDAARLCEIFGPLGADFLGINPVHALFLADPGRTSPYFPSTRQFLNPLYIALDQVAHAGDAISADEAKALRARDHVEYASVARLKRRALERAFERVGDEAEFEAFCAREGKPLEDFATFEALSEWLVDCGHGAGWHGWPSPFQFVDSNKVASFRLERAVRVRFHKWLQWIAARQLAQVQRRARVAGMRIGLYIDLAVGVAPDGAATWAAPDSYAPSTHVGAPPDLFNSAGQDWGLAPLRPSAMHGLQSGFAKDLGAAMRSAGAVRLDHAMGLKRLYWIPAGFEAREGGYIRYPLQAALDVLAHLSQQAHVVVIGEDLGTVPPGFRDTLEQADILGYRVLYFEKDGHGFHSPHSYTANALACISTHDLSPFVGWWQGKDIETRERLGKLDGDQAKAAREERTREKARLIEALVSEGLIGNSFDPDQAMPEDIFVAVHAYLARTPSRLVAVQLEDLARATEQVNLPGTFQEYQNWSLKLPLMLDQIADDSLLLRTLDAVARERLRAEQ